MAKNVFPSKKAEKKSVRIATVITIILLAVLACAILILLARLSGFGDSVIRSAQISAPVAAVETTPASETEAETVTEPEPEPVPDPYYPAGTLQVVDGRAVESLDGYGSRQGIDISEIQGHIDFEAVKNDGFDFVIIRIGYRGWGSGSIVSDSLFEENYLNAASAGLDVGIYFYSQAITEDEAEEEAQFVLNTLADRGINMPIYFDWEFGNSESARTLELDGSTIALCCNRFCDTITAAGYDTGVYLNSHLLDKTIDLELLEPYPVWMAEYDDVPACSNAYIMWQYSNLGEVAGINEYVDLDLQLIEIVG